MENFYKKLKDKIDSHPTTPTDWEMWDDVASKLDKKRRRYFLPIWFWVPIGALLFGGLGYLIGSANMNPMSTANASTIQSDTILIDRYITERDTIYKERLITKWRTKEDVGLIAKYESLSKKANDLAIANDDYLTSLDLYKQAIVNAELSDKPAFRNLPDLQDWILINGGVIRNDEERMAQGLDKLEGLDRLNMMGYLDQKMDIPQLHHFISNDYLLSLQKPPTTLQKIIPDYYNIGFSFDAPFISVNQDGAFGIEVGGGLHAALLFSRRFSLWTGVRIRNNNTTISSEELSMNYPQPTVPVGDEFKKLAIIGSYIDIPLEGKYKLTDERRYTPYIMIGGSVSMPLKTEYKYEYTSSGAEIYYEVKDQATTPSFGYALLGYGIESNPRERINLFGEAFLRYDFKNGSAILDNYHGVGIRLGLMYQL